ncbi:MAG: 3-phosphoglycerate dehydrogenase [Candidatus Aminicenantes bacterium]|nr:3-phosphoglycerate dehydrogenase [Candidatus Aminicenantes bacterium]NIM83029.1 3-phosphoglycerate dehydrogenase [Candidatus Aminicenantes bacterium]NIN22416.1 3-phosphoglycerate dehydrogenase [Candidatus Aminicenantes bacterium]NIN46184.1 3-phosphoglycerate dehydrogenase [Candidatus Aminicenantes bacterium]NIN89021.1 3-phosphoglycerate dehydrogenase [Candidatus Aminicenantes bacterium]
MIKVLLTDTLSQKAVELLKEIPEFEIVVKSGMTPEQLRQEIKNYEAVVVRGMTRLDGETLEGAEHLRIIVNAGVGLDNIDVEAAKSRHIEVRDTPSATAVTVAEYTLAQMLAICRYIGPAYQSMKAHKWEKKLFSDGMELYGKTAGIIGMGRIGKEVAKRELVMGMKVLYYDIVEVQTDMNARQVSLEELLRSSDFISIHLPLTESTRNLISVEAFEKMKDGVVFVNVARGGVVDESALREALETGKIKAVAIDVYEQEPLEDFSLIDQERVFPAPHLGASTVEAQERAGLEAILILKEFFNA